MTNAVPDKAKVIDGGATEIAVRVGDDGVWLGFFANDGTSACVHLDKLMDRFRVDGITPSEASLAALAKWAEDRRAA